MIVFINNLPFRIDQTPLNSGHVALGLRAQGIRTRDILVPQRVGGGNFGVAYANIPTGEPLYRANKLFGRQTVLRPLPGLRPERYRACPTTRADGRGGRWREAIAADPSLSEGHSTHGAAALSSWSEDADPTRHTRFDDYYDGSGLPPQTCPICERRERVRGEYACGRCLDKRPVVVIGQKRVWRKLPDGSGYPITEAVTYEVPTEYELDQGLRTLYERAQRAPLDRRYHEQFKRGAAAARFYAKQRNPDLSLLGTRLQRF